MHYFQEILLQDVSQCSEILQTSESPSLEIPDKTSLSSLKLLISGVPSTAYEQQIESSVEVRHLRLLLPE